MFLCQYLYSSALRKWSQLPRKIWQVLSKMFINSHFYIINLEWKDLYAIEIMYPQLIIFLADSSSHHQSWWKWMLMPQSFYNNGGGSRRTGYSPTTQYPFTSSYQYPRGSMNVYFTSYKPYNRNPQNSYYTR